MPASLDHLLDLLPQKPPARLVDHVLAVEAHRRVSGTVSFPPGHRVFDGHLPGDPLVPGVVIVEALAQLAGLTLVEAEGTPLQGYLGEVKRMRFHRLIRPGEEIRLEAEVLQAFGPFARYAARASVAGELAAEGELVLARREGG